ncbi:helix-hairpin-helix domain-containing protein [Balneola sp. MJW-20]|uniref:helix-hairpin-helix domain-containing protein n=1 Tax=Gracilimonas aurantiaca TaxID=3234185 RepID=UPI0034662D68
MRTFLKLVFSFTLFGLVITACEAPKNEMNSGDTANEQSSAEKSISDAVFNANLATESDLSSIGISAEMITQIMENRPFLSMNAFDAIMGDDMDKEELYRKIFVPMNLNTTEEADFKMIPGVGDRMAHEFEEYRPYSSILQFRREIGKYVDEEEVARYENYVFVPVELNTASEEDIKALPGVGDRMAHEFVEYRPYTSMEQFRKEIGKYVDDKELARLERFVYLED